MISELIKKEMESFFSEEIKRQKEKESLNSDLELKKLGITKNYLQLVENALAEKDIEKAKGLRDELESFVTKINDPNAKDKVATLGIEINNLIDLEEKIIKNKKDFQMRIEGIEGDDKKGFFEKETEMNEEENRIKKIFEKGITETKAPSESFFMAKPDKIVVNKNITTPDQPIPTKLPLKAETINSSENNEFDNKEKNNSNDVERPSIQIIPEKIKAELIKDPKEGHESEFSNATFMVHELSSFIKEKELEKSKEEYNTARSLIQKLPDCEEKNQLMKELFDDYHSIKELEREIKIQEEERKRKQLEIDRLKQIEIQKKAMEEKELEKRKEERQKEFEKELAHKKMLLQAKEHQENNKNIKKEFEENKIGKEIIPPNKPNKIGEKKNFKDIQQKILDAKHEQIKYGGSNTAKFLQTAQESLNKDRALKIQNKEEIKKENILDFKIEIDNSSYNYNKAVSMIYEGKKDLAKKLLIEIIKNEPNNLAAKIRLKECEL